MIWLLRIIGCPTSTHINGTLVPVEEPSTASIAAMRAQAYVGMKRGPSIRFWMFRNLFHQALK
jgi:hypothetical protein